LIAALVHDQSMFDHAAHGVTLMLEHDINPRVRFFAGWTSISTTGVARG